MRKLNFYGMELSEGGVRKTVHRFPFLKDLDAWIKGGDESTFRYQIYATDPEVRRVLRQVASGESPGFPVQVG